MCCSHTRYRAYVYNTGPYSPAARRHLALRGGRSLPRLRGKEGEVVVTDDTKYRHGTRPRGYRLAVWVTEEERDLLTDRAAEAGMSTSAYLRAAGLNHPVRSVYDLHAVRDMAKVNGDLGRVAGLLKLWLADYRGWGATPAEVEKMMVDFRALQAELSTVMGRALRDR